MLTIPDSVKQLYMRDGVRKNFRVTFPNGEFPDITNEQIVEESVKFNESIMSQNKFRFGLAESPQISFECVGVSNLLGMQIQCWHEIDVTSLSAADIAAIEAGTWDGEYIPLNDSDLGFAYFRLPLGIFTVDSCPRSHGAMNHRQVKATGKSIGTNEEALDPFTKWKISQQYTSNKWIIDWGFLCPSVYGDTWEEAGKYYDSTPIATVDDMFTEPGGPVVIHSDSGEVTNINWANSIGFSAREKSIGNASAHATTPYTGGTLLRIYRNGFSYSAMFATLRAKLDEVFTYIESQNTVDWSATYYLDSNSVRHPLGTRDACLDYMANASIDLNGGNTWRPKIVMRNKQYYLLPKGGGFKSFDAVANLSFPTNTEWYILIPFTASSCTVRWIVNSSTTKTRSIPDFTIPDSSFGFEELELKDEYSVDFPTLKLPTTLKTKVGNTTYYGYFNSFSVRDLLTGFFETNGIFGRIKRDGMLEFYAITTTAAATLSQSDVQSLWWDESTVLPVGSVNVKFKASESSNELSEAVIEIGEGSSTYNMTNNVMLTGWAISLADLSAILRGNFSENVQVLTWTPTDATVRGLPWLEAGDWVVIATGAADVPTVGIPYLDREMSGIQLLTDTITCNSGDTIEVTQ